MTTLRRPGGPRYLRLALASASATVTVVALLGGMGLINTAQQPAQTSPAMISAAQVQKAPLSAAPAAPSTSPSAPTAAGLASTGALAGAAEGSRHGADLSLPARSGQGRRVVFSEERQRVWLVANNGEVRSTYVVSGSIYENLEPGRFEVWSRSMNAVGIDDSGTMKYFVRFARGTSGAAIGFHDIPIKDGDRVQRFDQLGTPLSHGCIRQRRSDAKRLWAFAPIGTQVVVTA